MADERTDEQLMTSVKGGDVDAFAHLVDRHHQRAVNVAFRLTGDPDVSRDIAQESFLKILRGAERYEPRARFTTFLYTVVRNLVADAARKSRGRTEVGTGGNPIEEAPPDRVFETPSTGDGPDATLERKEFRESLLAALEVLPEDLREAFVLTELEGLRYREAAEVCGCPEGTIASRKHLALERLRRELKPFDPEGNNR